MTIAKLAPENGLHLLVGSDAYYHLRSIEYILASFPHSLGFDAYTQYPFGANSSFMPLYDTFMAGTAWIAGLGHPGQDIIYSICIYMPVVFAIITIIVTFFLARDLFESTAIGIWAAALLAVMPGMFFATSVAGYADNHIAEVMLSTLLVYALVRGIKYLKYAELGREAGNTESRLVKKAVIYSSLAGALFGVLVHTGDAGLYLAPVLLIYFVVKQVDDYIHDIDIEIQTIFAAAFFAAAALVWALLFDTASIDYIISCMGIVSGIGVLAYELDRRKKPKTRMYRYLGICIFLLAVYAHLNGFGISELLPKVIEPATLTELKSIFAIDDDLYWTNFAVCGYITILSLGTLYLRKLSGISLFIFIWSAGTAAAAIVQSRFACFFAVNVAIMTAYGLSELWDYLKLKCQKLRPVALKAVVPRVIMAVLIIGTVAESGFLLENEVSQFYSANGVETTLNQPWLQTLEWLAHNTKDPGIDMTAELLPTHYAAQNITRIKYPEQAYGVLSAGSYGNYIQMLGQRMPVASPYSDNNISSDFFSAQSETAAIRVLPAEGKVRYVITDFAMATSGFEPTTKLSPSKYSVVAMKFNGTLAGSGKTMNFTLFLPAKTYYDSMVFRLQILDGAGLEHFRLVHETGTSNSTRELDLKTMYNQRCNKSIDIGSSGYVKVFEYVKGAKLKGTAQPGTKVTIETPITTNLGRTFNYTRIICADKNGVYAVTVPYAQLYTVTANETTTIIDINETEVIYGVTKNI